ncbi:alpha-hydroxy-acid oxidizing protein [Spongiibacter sp. KMU-158]|uniref:Alpha-hydroxy-acid oxidizing protein n=1 Tax=Spongiibacter pelagi TaxID=2760804 RepID=A0A927GXC6_9GAMM|nr:alpha-hydroxy acid oxidase [Spongiibacter pelagi]MBD2860028.1 alpha-hydroxy-acid oxidizing protein [Spongiibacter pelagi]
MNYPPILDRIPPDILCLDDYERYALEFIAEPYLSYFQAGVADEQTLQLNRHQFDAHRILPRVLVDFDAANSGVDLFGRRHQSPILLGPVAHQGLIHPDAECATRFGADAVGVTTCASTLSSKTLEDIAAVSAEKCWFQLYFQSRREDTLALVRRAEQAGFEALLVTVDTPVNGLRNRIQRSGFALPAEVKEANLLGQVTPESRVLSAGQSVVLNGYMADAPSWKEIIWLREQTDLPILIKGILHPEDAAKAVAVGADGIVVSNHGGRSLDGVPATIDVITAVRQRVGDCVPVLLDGGIRRGTDIFKAIALGADAVLLGRPQVYALAVAGALGVAHMLKLLQEELHIAMALAGCPDLAAVRRATLPPARLPLGV